MLIRTLYFALAFGACLASPLTDAANEGGFEAALRATLTRHPAVSGKEAEVEAKGYGGDAARAQRYPSLSAQASADNETTPSSLQVRQPVWAFGRIDASIAYADADQVVEQADLLRVKRQLLDQTATAYARLQGIYERLRVSEGNIDSLSALFERIRRRAEGQLASSADVRLAFARLVQARAQKSRLEGELALARTDLYALTQTPVSAQQAVPDEYAQLSAAAELKARAQESSADVLLSAQKVALARAERDREKTASRPTVYLQAERFFGQSSSFDDGERLSVVLEANLEGLGFVAAGRNKSASARLNASQENLRVTRNDLDRTIDSLYANRKMQEAVMRSQYQSVQELTEILASYQRQYEAGHKAWLDVLNMQRELTEQQLQLVQAENDWLIYSLRLAALSGGLDAIAGLQQD